jgi:Ca2+-binding EF-hand superfamily protein
MKRLMLAAALTAALMAEAGAQAATPAAVATPAADSITRDEALGRADNLFELLDSNHDGILTRGEAERSGLRLRALGASLHRDIAHGIGGHTMRFFEHRFADSKTVTREQFEQAMLAHFDAMDANHDGILTADERGGAQ